MTNEEKRAIEKLEFSTVYPHPYKEDDGYLNRNEYAINKIFDVKTVINLVKKQQKQLEINNKMFRKMAEHIYDLEEFIPGCSLYECNKNMSCTECIMEWAENEVKKEN